MCEKFTIINILNKLAAEHSLSWQIQSAFQDGQGQNQLEIFIYSLPRRARRGHIVYDGNSGQIYKAQYAGIKGCLAPQIIDMLLDVLNFEKRRSKDKRNDKPAVSAR
jgi:hypothetical protein